jgi:hypothetical protein
MPSSGPIPVIPSAVWNAIGGENMHVDGYWSLGGQDKYLHLEDDGEGGFKLYLAIDTTPLEIGKISIDDWNDIKNGTLESNSIMVGEDEYKLHFERGGVLKARLV